MPIYMDRHYVEGATQHAIAHAHEKDLKIAEKYGIQFMTYWFDEARSTAFCLVNAPDMDAIRRAHEEAHGLVPSEIIEVDPSLVEAFLGRVSDPVRTERSGPPDDHSPATAFRVIMFTDLEGSTAMTQRLGDAKALHLLHIHNALTRDALRAHAGREVKHTGDGMMASFVLTTNALHCAMMIQSAFAAHNGTHPEAPLHLRIGLSAGEPVEENHDLFGAAVQLGARVCAHAQPGQILAAQVVVDHCPGESHLFSSAGQITPRGFDHPLPVYEVRWQ